MADSTTTADCAPPAGTTNGTWHWLRHELNGSLIVSEWEDNPSEKWTTGKGWWDSSVMGPVGAKSTDMHLWGWRYYAPAIPPKDECK